MAKVPFSKLKCKINEEVAVVPMEGIDIELKQYLPISEKLGLITTIIQYSHEEDTNYSNPVKMAAIRDLEIVNAYTNISFTDKQKEDLSKLFDQMYSTGVLQQILDNIPESEIELIYKGTKDCLESIYNYRNSVFGILESIKEDYQDTNFNLENIKEVLASDELGTLKEIITKLG